MHISRLPAIGLLAALSIVTMPTSGSATYNLSEGTVEAFVGYRQNVDLMEIPAGAEDVFVMMFSKTDVDLRLYEKTASDTAKTLIGRIAHPTTVTTDTMTIDYSGYAGVNGRRGFEHIIIDGIAPNPLTVGAYGYRKGAVEVYYSYAITPPTGPIAPAFSHRPICNNVGTDTEGWYWADTEELIANALCAQAGDPQCGGIGTDYEGWEATNWQNEQGWPSTTIMENISHTIVREPCRHIAGIAMAGESCDESNRCYDAYNLECTQGTCTNRVIEDDLGCQDASECAPLETCGGFAFDGVKRVGRCVLHPETRLEGENDPCETDGDCNQGLKCTNWGVPGQWSECYPEWMLGEFNDFGVTSGPLPIVDKDGSADGVTRSYYFVTGLATVPLTALISFEIEHENPEDSDHPRIRPVRVPAGIRDRLVGQGHSRHRGQSVSGRQQDHWKQRGSVPTRGRHGQRLLDVGNRRHPNRKYRDAPGLVLENIEPLGLVPGLLRVERTAQGRDQLGVLRHE